MTEFVERAMKQRDNFITHCMVDQSKRQKTFSDMQKTIIKVTNHLVSVNSEILFKRLFLVSRH